MTPDMPDNNETQQPIINLKETEGLIDYYCPFCNQKLFRGKVTHFNMVCSNCNRLVRSEDIPDKDPEEI